MHFIESSTGDSPFENAIVLLGIHVERFLIHGSVILDLVDRRFWLSRLLGLRLGIWLAGRREMVLEEEVGGVRNRRGCGRRAG